MRVVNVPARFVSIGDKRNAGVDLARGELIAPWDDDDISLPWRLALPVERLGDAYYFNPRCYWFLDNDGFHVDHAVGLAHNASLFRCEALEGTALDAAFATLARGCRAQVLRTTTGKLASCQSWKGASTCLLIGGGTT